MTNVYTNRYELKYIIDYPTYLNIKEEIRPFVKKDPMGNKDGKYKVLSLYYDSPGFKFFSDKINGQKDKIKLRIRKYKAVSFNYNKIRNVMDSEDLVYIELKRRVDQTVIKSKLESSEYEAYKLLQRNCFNFFEQKNIKKENKDFISELIYLKNTLHLKPVALIYYIRQAFFSSDSLPLRITFDTEIKARTKHLKIEQSPHLDGYIMPPNFVVMEVKYSEVLPIWVIHLLQKYDCQKKTFSKYCQGIIGGLIKQHGLVY